MKKEKKHDLSDTQETKVLNFEQENIMEWIENVHFRKQAFGGVIEEDVWKKIDELNELYNKALIAERERYDVLLEQQEERYKKGSISNENTSIKEG